MRFLRGVGRSTRRRQRVARTVSSANSGRLEPFLPNRSNRHWWVGGLLVTLVLTFVSLPADFHRRVPDPVGTARQREIARKNTPPIYVLDRRGIANAEAVFGYVQDVLSLPGLSKTERINALESFPLTRHYLTASDLAKLLDHEDRFLEVREETLRILNRVLARGVVLGGYGEGSLRAVLATYFDPKYTTRWSDVESMVIRVYPQNELVSVADTLTMDDAILEVDRLVRTLPARPEWTAQETETLRSLIRDLTRPFIGPNLFFNEQATRDEQNARAAAVPPQYVDRYERPVSVYIGTFVIVAIMAVMSGLFLMSQPTIRNPNYRLLSAYGLMLVGAVALVYVMVRVVARNADIDYPILVVPVSATAALSSILLGSPFGIFSTVFLSVLSGLMTGVGATFIVPQFLSLLSAGFLAAYAMNNVHHRKDLVIAGVYTSLAATAVVFGAALVQTQVQGGEMVRVVAWAFAGGLIVTAIVPGLLPPFESLAGTATDLELLDLSDLNHPLLLQLQKAATGTFNHSLNVSRLAEAAAELIGENALLARVGAYYHDIGKMNYPQYFIENQEGGPNPHDRLTPTMSARVLIAHVKDGIELGKEHKLPRAVIDLIPEHHGTSLIRSFYHKAREQGNVVDEAEFRYPGPKPQTKVGAVMLLADSVEAAANARFKNLNSLGRRDCHQLVAEMVNQYVLDGQLDQCDLTLNDLRLLSDSFERTLMAMYHSRIEYPKEIQPSPPSAERIAVQNESTA